jgi:hypothetical protein
MNVDNVDLNNLSDEVLLYSNDRFYQFVEKCLGPDELVLVKLQAIKSTRALINVPDILAVLDLDCPELNDIKKRICFVTESNELVLKAGVKCAIEDFTNTLKAKNDEYLQRTKKTKKASQVVQSNQTVPQINASTSITPVSAVDPTQSISDSIEKYSKTILSDIILSNNIDYSIQLTQLNTSVDAKIKCNCGVIVKINHRPDRNAFQLSPYFKHLKTIRCSMMKKKREVKTNVRKLSDSSCEKAKLPRNDHRDSEDIIDDDQDLSDGDDDDVHTTLRTSAPIDLHLTRKRQATSYTSSSITRKKARTF